MMSIRSLLVPLALVLLLAAPAAGDADATSAGQQNLEQGLAHLQNGEAEKAVQSFADAQAAFKEAKDGRAKVAMFFGRAAQQTVEGNSGEAAAQFINAGSHYFTLKHLDEAIETLNTGIAMAQAADHKKWEGRARSMLTQVLQAAGRPKEAIEEGKRAVAMATEGKDDQPAAAAAFGMAKAYFDLRQYGKAADVLKPGLEAAQRVKWGAAIMQCVSWLAWVYYHLEDYEQARIWYGHELNVRKQMKDQDGIDTAYTNLGQIIWELEDYDALEKVTNDALTRAEETDRPLLAAQMHQLRSMVDVARGHARRGVKHSKQAEAAFKKAGAKKQLAPVYLGMGKALTRMGSLSKAQRYFEKAKAIAIEAKDPANQVRAHIDLAGAHSDLGKYDEALDELEQGIALARKTKDRANERAAVSTLGVVLWALNDLERSLQRHQEAHAIAEELGDAHHEAVSLGNIGTVLTEMGEYDEALEWTDKALALADRRKQAATRAIFMNTKAELLAKLGKPKEAAGIVREALVLAEKHGTPSEQHRMRVSLSRYLLTEADGQEGVDMLREVIDDAHSYRNVLDEVEARRILSAHLLNKGENDDALREAKAAARELEDVLGPLGEGHGASARRRYSSVYAVGAVAAARAERPRDAFKLLEQGRAGLLVGQLRARDLVDWDELPADLIEAQAQARAKVTEAQARVAALPRRANLKKRREASEALEHAIGEAREIADRVQREAKRQADLVFPRVPPIGEIQDNLADGQAFVLYGLGAAEAIAVVVTPDDERVVSLGSTKAIEKALAAVDLGSPDKDAAAALAAVQEKLRKPLGLAKEIEDIVVSPDGALCEIPLNMVFAERRVALTPSATTYAHLAEESEAVAGKRVLAMGDPVYGASASSTVARAFTRTRSGRDDERWRSGLSPLPGTRDEVEAVGDTKLLGKDANEAGFRKALAEEERWRSVHFACHGLVNPDAADLCSLALTQEGKDDGFLTAGELLQMRIPTDMAVLSACETGRGSYTAGEGLLGLARSFIYAGAPRVLCSLWKVDDEATKAFMIKFYELWNPKPSADGKPKKGLPPAEALRQAQDFIKSQEKWKHPYYWGAWVLWGLPQ